MIHKNKSSGFIFSNIWLDSIYTLWKPFPLIEFLIDADCMDGVHFSYPITTLGLDFFLNLEAQTLIDELESDMI